MQSGCATSNVPTDVTKKGNALSAHSCFTQKAKEIAFSTQTPYNDSMNTKVRTQTVVITNSSAEQDSGPWLAEDPEWRMHVSLRALSNPYGGESANRMRYENAESLLLAVVERTMQMGLSMHIDLFWETGYSHSKATYNRIYKILSMFDVEVTTGAKGGVPQYTKPVPYGKAYVPNPSLPKAVWVDVDGTLFKMCDRSPFDWSRVGEDTPHEHVFDVVRSLQAAGYKVVVLSGRDEVCRDATVASIEAEGVHVDAIYMRPAGDDKTPDDVLKHDLFWEHVADKFDVKLALDDRNKVVSFTRDVLKIPVFQVAPGDF